MEVNHIIAKVHVFKSEGALRQYAYAHKGDTSEVPMLLVFSARPYKVIDDMGLHSIANSIGRLIAKQLKLESNLKSATDSNVMLVQIDQPNTAMVAEYTFEG